MAPDQENDHDSQAEEILNYRASNRDVHPREHSDDEEEEELSDDDSEFEVIHDPLSQQPPSRRKHSASTVQSFELYTPEEERAVIRKLDRGVVLPLAGLYLLSFIDRSSKLLPWLCNAHQERGGKARNLSFYTSSTTYIQM